MSCPLHWARRVPLVGNWRMPAVRTPGFSSQRWAVKFAGNLFRTFWCFKHVYTHKLMSFRSVFLWIQHEPIHFFQSHGLDQWCQAAFWNTSAKSPTWLEFMPNVSVHGTFRPNGSEWHSVLAPESWYFPSGTKNGWKIPHFHYIKLITTPFVAYVHVFSGISHCHVWLLDGSGIPEVT